MHRLTFLILAAGLAHADPHVPWRIDYDGGPPERFEAGGDLYLAIVYTLDNRGRLPAPLAVGHVLHCKGRDDMRDGFFPDVVLAVAARHEGLEGLSKPLREEAVARLREKRKWFGMSDVTKLRELKAGESLQAVAVFRVTGDLPATIDSLVEGLEDPAVMAYWEWASLPYEALHVRLRTRYEFAAGVATPKRRDWIAIAPDAPVDREDFARLVNDLQDENPAIRIIALRLLMRYVEPRPPLRREEGARFDRDAWQAMERAFRKWIAGLPEVVRLQAAAPEERRRFAEELLRRDKAFKPVADALRDPAQYADFDFARAIDDALASDETTTRCVAIQLLREWSLAETHGFDAAMFDPESEAPQDDARAAIRAWREWLVRFSGTSVWNPDTRCWEIPGR